MPLMLSNTALAHTDLAEALSRFTPQLPLRMAKRPQTRLTLHLMMLSQDTLTPQEDLQDT